MALIRCRECGKHITDTIKKCPHCGHKNEKYRNIPLEKIKSKKFLIITIIIIMIFSALGGNVCYRDYKEKNDFANFEAGKLSEEEKTTVKALKNQKSHIKNTDLTNISEIWYRKTNVADNQILIKISSNNSSKNIIKFINNEKMIGDDSKADKNVEKYTSKIEKEEITKSKEIREMYNTKGGYIEPFVKLDTEKILKNL